MPVLYQGWSITYNCFAWKVDQSQLTNIQRMMCRKTEMDRKIDQIIMTDRSYKYNDAL